MRRETCIFPVLIALWPALACTSAKSSDATEDAGTGATADGSTGLDPSDGGADADDAGDGAPRTCAPAHAAPLDEARHCLKARVDVPEVCVEVPAKSKGLYALCIFGPGGQAYSATVTRPVRATAPGWTFAPASVASALELPAASATDEARCFGVDAIDAGPTCP
ncbi:MAG: hypothetical protein U0235_11620 [Polyangiaceae bacterium]